MYLFIYLFMQDRPTRRQTNRHEDRLPDPQPYGLRVIDQTTGRQKHAQRRDIQADREVNAPNFIAKNGIYYTYLNENRFRKRVERVFLKTSQFRSPSFLFHVTLSLQI